MRQEAKGSEEELEALRQNVEDTREALSYSHF